jgi:hypothetical protein
MVYPSAFITRDRLEICPAPHEQFQKLYLAVEVKNTLFK